MKSLLCIVFAVLMAAGCCLYACGREGTTDNFTQTSGTETAAAEESTAISGFASMPAEDLDGYEFRIGDNSEYEWIQLCTVVTEETGDVVNDAVYKANISVEDKYGMKITGIRYTNLDSVKSTILANDNAYEMVTGHDYTLGTMSLTGIFMDICQLDNIDFGNVWWPEYSVNSLRINGRMVLFSNFISYFGLSRARVFFINKSLCEDFNIEVPYEDVFNGTWTLDKLGGMVKTVYKDVDGNSEKDINDVYGWVNLGFITMQESFGLDPYRQNDGVLELVYDLDKMSSAVQKLYSIVYESSGVIRSAPDKREDQEIFIDGRSLVYFDSLGMASSSLRVSSVDYGIFNIPKFDENQKDYIAGYTDYLHVVPVTAADTGNLGLIIEAMSAAGYEIVYPAFVDIALKNKYTYDDNSAKVIDIIGSRMYISFAYINASTLATTFKNLLTDKPNTDVASFFAKNEAAERKIIDAINEQYGK